MTAMRASTAKSFMGQEKSPRMAEWHKTMHTGEGGAAKGLAGNLNIKALWSEHHLSNQDGPLPGQGRWMESTHDAYHHNRWQCMRDRYKGE